MGLAVLLFDCESSLELFAPFAVWDLNHLILCFLFSDSWVFLVFWDSSPALSSSTFTQTFLRHYMELLLELLHLLDNSLQHVQYGRALLRALQTAAQ